VTQASQTITFGAVPSQALGGVPLTLNATASSGLAVTFTSMTASICTVSGATVTLVKVGTCTIQATQAGNSNYTAAKAVSQSFTVSPGVLSIGSILSAGSFAAVPLTCDGYTVIFGTDFSTTTAQATSLTLPTTLAGTTVTVADSTGNSKKAALVYVSPIQINFLVPAGLASGSATVTVTNPGGTQVSLPATIAAVSPSLFTADSSGRGVAAALALVNATGAPAQVVPVFSCTNSPLACTPVPIDLGPASTTVFLELYGTGIRGRTGLSGVSATVGSTALPVSYASAQGTYDGLDQVNVALPRALAGAGTLTLQLVVDGQAANPVVIAIK
jgi:uncharacterized protein (TIGR03437 family)